MIIHLTANRRMVAIEICFLLRRSLKNIILSNAKFRGPILSVDVPTLSS
jgi:hypothetical protein